MCASGKIIWNIYLYDLEDKMKQYIEAGKIVNTHGVRGALKVESWCDSPKVLSSLKKIYSPKKSNGEQYKEINVLKASVLGDRVLMTLEGIETVEAAASLKNTVIFAHRNDIPVKEGSFLICDLIGLPVINIDSKKVYGTLSDVIQGGAGDIYEIKTKSGTALMPAVKEFVKEIKLEDGIYISPIEGMFDEI